jgi:hypothetical protein
MLRARVVGATASVLTAVTLVTMPSGVHKISRDPRSLNRTLDGEAG